MIFQDSVTGDIAAASANGRLATEAITGIALRYASEELTGGKGLVKEAVKQRCASVRFQGAQLPRRWGSSRPAARAR